MSTTALRDTQGRFIKTAGNPAYDRLKDAVFAENLATKDGQARAYTLLRFGATLLGVAS